MGDNLLVRFGSPSSRSLDTREASYAAVCRVAREEKPCRIMKSPGEVVVILETCGLTRRPVASAAEGLSSVVAAPLEATVSAFAEEDDWDAALRGYRRTRAARAFLSSDEE